MIKDKKRCLIYLDHKEIQNSIDLLEVARQIFQDEPYETTGVELKNESETMKGAFDNLIQVNHPEIKVYDQVAVTDVMVQLQKANNYDCILIPATYYGRILAPRLAMHLGVGLVADVTAIGRINNDLEMIRPAFSGRIMAGIISKSKSPIMMSVRQGVFHYKGQHNKVTNVLEYVPTNIKDGGISCLSIKNKEQIYDIRESDVLVSGGGGVAKNFHHLEKLANKLKGQVSASRKIVDQGKASRSIQVGQSGKTVSPKLYIALGIYGSIQHVEGLKNVDYIISVNINRDAPICSLSDIVVEGDAVTFIEKLMNKIEENECVTERKTQ